MDGKLFALKDQNTKLLERLDSKEDVRKTPEVERKDDTAAVTCLTFNTFVY